MAVSLYGSPGPKRSPGARAYSTRAGRRPEGGDKGSGVHSMDAFGDWPSDLPRTSFHSLCDVAPSRADRHVAERRTSDGGGGGISLLHPEHRTFGSWTAHRRTTTTTTNPPLPSPSSSSRDGHSRRFAVYLASRAETQAQGCVTASACFEPQIVLRAQRVCVRQCSRPYPCCGSLCILYAAAVSLCTRYGLPSTYRRRVFWHVPPRLAQVSSHYASMHARWRVGTLTTTSRLVRPQTLPEIQVAL